MMYKCVGFEIVCLKAGGFSEFTLLLKTKQKVSKKKEKTN